MAETTIQKGFHTSAPEQIRSHMNHFFGESSTEYDRAILQIVPVYEAMFEQLLDHVWLPLDAPLTIVELGCGTGNLTQVLLRTYPHAKLTIVDASADMLARTGEKLSEADKARTILKTALFNEVELPEGQADLVISSLALHHVPDNAKQELYDRIFRWLAPDGRFRCADLCLALPDPIGYQHNLHRWKELVRANGISETLMAEWITHFETADHYASLKDHFDLMAQAGFTATDCYWRMLFWAIYGGHKPQ